MLPVDLAALEALVDPADHLPPLDPLSQAYLVLPRVQVGQGDLGCLVDPEGLPDP